MKFLLTASALSLSSIAAYFSIVGLSTIFPGSIFSIVVMALGLEFAKIIVAVWTHQNWKRISILTKSYLSFAVFILMGITSTGIFGFLSKSHIEHSSSVSFSENIIKEIERKIELEEGSINRHKSLINEKKSVKNSFEDKNNKIISQLSGQIDSIYSRLDIDVKLSNEKIDKLQSRIKDLDNQVQELRNQKTGFFSSNKSKIDNLEASQKEEREYIASQLVSLNDSIVDSKKSASSKVEELRAQINSLQSKDIDIEDEDLSLISSYENKIKEALSSIEQLNLEKFKLESENLKIENELGPIKYIAEFIKEFGGPELNTSGSIRLVILLIVCVFDPLAIVMIICAFSLNNSSSPLQSSKEKDLKSFKFVTENNDSGIISEEDPNEEAVNIKESDKDNPSKEKKLVRKDGYSYYE